MKQMVFIGFILYCLLSSSNAFAVDQVTVSPPNPRAGDAITISFRTSSSDEEIINWPLVWELSGTGPVRDLKINGHFCDCIPFATSPPPSFSTMGINIGSLPAGDYEIYIHVVGPGLLPNTPLGSVSFSVGAAPMPIPTLNTLGLTLLVLSVLGLVWAKRRGVSSLQ